MTGLSASITFLADQIQRDTKLIESYLQTNNLPPLSLAENALPFFPGTGPTGLDPFPPPPQEITEARRSLRESCELLLQLASTPVETLLWTIATSHQQSSAVLQYVYHFGIAAAVPLNGHINFKDLADKVGVDESQCTRILRTLMTQYVFHEPSTGNVSHTAMSKLLTLPGLQDTIGYLLEESFIGAPRISETAEKYQGSEERNHTPWNVGHAIDLPIFDFFETQPARGARFFRNMESMGSQGSYDIRHTIGGYDWASLDQGTLVDVAGSNGHVSIAISKVAPHLDFVVQDLAQVVAKMNELTKEKPHDRVRFEAHNFFEEQPIKNARVYLLRYILHDYSDKYAVRILKALIPALGPQSRIVLFDGIMPPPNTLPKHEERKAR